MIKGIYNNEEIIENFFQPLAVFDKAGDILTVNKNLLEFFEYTFDEVLGNSIYRLISRKEKTRFKGVLEKIFGGKKIEDFNISILTKAGIEIPASFSGFPVHNKEGSIQGGFGLFTDVRQIQGLISSLGKAKDDMEFRVRERVAELGEKVKELDDSKRALMNILEEVEDTRKKAEEEKNKTLAIIANFSDGLLVFDKDNILSSFNSQAEKFFGIKSGEIIGRHISDLSQTPYLFALKSILEKEPENIFRRRIILRENLIIEVSVAEIRKEKEKIGFFIIAHDITREEGIERMKSEFVSISAHQLRTPLSAIKWTLRAILDGDVGQLSPGQAELLQKTYISNERMIDLVNDLLDVTRIEEGKNLFKPALAAIEPVVQFVINSFKGESDRRQVNIEFKKPFLEKIPKVILDVEKIKLAFQNLLGNALRYTPPGGRVTLTLKHDKKEIELIIKDTGIGIPRDQQPKIFTKFFRSQNAIRMETEGSGLGLFITKNIVEAHNGRIWFESEENNGSTFHVAIPIGEEFEEFLKEF